MADNSKEQGKKKAAEVVNMAMARASRRHKPHSLFFKYFKRISLLSLGVLIFIVLIYSEDQSLSHVTIVNKDKNGTEQLEVQATRNGHYILRGFINGKPVIFMVDTGATVISMSGSDARKLQLHKGPRGLAETAAGTAEVFDSHINSAQIGNIKILNLRVSITPKMKTGHILLGMNFLKHLTLSQKNGVLTMSYKKKH